jgi:transposase-like protein
MLTEEKVRLYVQTGGVRCLYCGSGNIEAGLRDEDSECMSQEVQCHDCKKEWLDIYRLQTVVEVEDE